MPNVHFRCRLLAVALLASMSVAGPASAALYKWTDANGRVVYSDQPPIGIKAESVQAPSAPSNPNALKEMISKDAELRKRQTEAAESEKKSEAQRAEAAKRAQMCTRAQGQLRQLAAEQVALTKINEKGQLVTMDESQRRKERADVETWIKANCMPS